MLLLIGSEIRRQEERCHAGKDNRQKVSLFINHQHKFLPVATNYFIYCTYRSLNDLSDYNPRGGKFVRREKSGGSAGGGGGKGGGGGGGFKGKGGAGGKAGGGKRDGISKGKPNRPGKDARTERRASRSS